MPIPFLGGNNSDFDKPPTKKELERMRQEQINQSLEEAYLEGRTKEQMQDAFDMSPRNPQSNLSSYYEKTQLSVYDEEINLLRAFLQGKIEVEKDGKKTYVYPEEILFEVQYIQQIKDEKGKTKNVEVVDWMYDSFIDDRYMQRTGRFKKQQIKKPLANPEGQRDLLNFASSKIRGTTALSIFSIATALKYTMDDGLLLAENIYSNLDEWGINPLKVEFIVMNICDRIDAVRRRAVDGAERELPSKNMSITNINSNQTGGTKLPLLGNLHNQKAGI